MTELTVERPFIRLIHPGKSMGELRFVVLKQTTPAWIARQLLGGQTIKWNHPVFESAIVGVHVMGVERAINMARF